MRVNLYFKLSRWDGRWHVEERRLKTRADAPSSNQECKKRMNAFKNKYDQGLLKLEDVPRKDSGVPPAIP